MKKSRKVLPLLIALVAVATLIFALAACDPMEPEITPPSTDGGGNDDELFVPDLDYAEPLGGSGTASYTDGARRQISSQSWDPFKIECGNYKFKFESAKQRIYLEVYLRTKDYGLYNIRSAGGVDASVQTITGDPNSALFNPTRNSVDNDGRAYFNNNKDDATKDFLLEFSNNDSTTQKIVFSNGEVEQRDGIVRFELALENAEHVGHEFAVIIEKLDKPYVPKAPTAYAQIHADPAPEKATRGEGNLNAIPLDAANFVVTRASDGTYRLGGEEGALLYANLDGPWPLGATLQSGQPMTCITRTLGGTNPYRWVTEIHDEGDKGEDWLPFLCEYVGYVIDSDGTPVAPGKTNENTGFVNKNSTNCNEDGFYPVNDMIVRFLTMLYNDMEIQNFYFTPDNYMGSTWFLPKGYEWIFMCGYYGEEYRGADFGGKGTAQEPFEVTKAGEFEIDVPAGGKVWFKTGLSYALSSNTAGALLEVDGKTSGEDGNGFAYTISVSEGSSKTFAISLINREAGRVSLTIEDAQIGEGTLQDPYQMSGVVGSYSAKATAGGEIWYTFIECAGKYVVTAASADITIEIFDLDGYMAIEDGKAAQPIASVTGGSGTFEIDDNEYYFVVRCAAEADIAWEIARSE